MDDHSNHPLLLQQAGGYLLGLITISIPFLIILL